MTTLALPMSIDADEDIGTDEEGHMLARDLARWLVWRWGAYSPRRPKAAGMRPVASAPMGRHQPPCWGVGLAPAVMLGIGLRV